jgi:hypothetical protein
MTSRRGWSVRRAAVAAASLTALLLVGFSAARPEESTVATDARTYHVSSTGDDSRDGLTAATAWRTPARVAQVALRPGDRVLFEAGSVFEGSVDIGPDDGGDAANPVLVGSYGVGRAVLQPGGSPAVTVRDTSGVAVRDLVLRGSTETYTRDSGLLVESSRSTGPRYSGIVVDGVDVSGFRRGIDVRAAALDAGFSDLRISRSRVHDNRDVGLGTFGPDWRDDDPRYAHSDVVVSEVEADHNRGDTTNTTRHSGSGMFLSSVAGGAIERSSAHHNGEACSAPEGPVGIWAFNADSVSIQHNVSYSNRTANVDGGGFGLDVNTSRSLLQYNLSYDNAGPGFMLYSSYPNTAHVANTVRFNISQGDVRVGSWYGALTVYGWVNDSALYHNTVVLLPRQDTWPPVVLAGGTIRGVAIRNNILVNGGKGPVATVVDPADQVLALQGNDYAAAEPSIAKWGDVLFRSLAELRAGSGQEMLDGAPVGLAVEPEFADGAVRTRLVGGPGETGAFALSPGSPLAAAGIDLRGAFGTDPGPVDVFGTPTRTRTPAVGAAQPPAP